jgi:hypothetical protein
VISRTQKPKQEIRMASLQALWDDLNERQRTYLQALYECDQASEAERRDLAARGFYDRTPASKWRWQMYGPTEPPSPLYQILRQAGLVDPGTGSTWQALQTRGLVLTDTRREPLGDFLLVQMTPLGRKLVRTATNQQRVKAPPKGQLRERQWAALARLYAAGNDGLSSDFMLYGEYGSSFKGFDWTRTLLRLCEYRPQPLVEQYSVWRRIQQRDGEHTQQDHWMRLTDYGRSYYQQEWARYRELYPNVEAPAPTKS